MMLADDIDESVENEVGDYVDGVEALEMACIYIKAQNPECSRID